MKPSHSRSHRRSGGYILILCVSVLALLMLGATYMGRQISVALAVAESERQDVEEAARMADARARVLFLLSILPRTIQGIGMGNTVIAPDGRLYRLDEHTAVSFQDTRGLLSLSAVGDTGIGRTMMERLLGTYGVDSDTSARLIDALLDYRDTDPLRRLNGAEAEEYRAIGKEYLLRNDDLKTPRELVNVYGWAEVEALWGDDPITNHVGINQNMMLNPNTAGWRVLVALAGATPETAQDLLGSRRRGEILDVTPLVMPGLSGDPFAGGPSIVKLVGRELQVSFFPRNGRPGIRIHVTHLPLSNYAPWRIQYVERVQPDKALLTEWDQIPLLPNPDQIQDFTATNQVQLPF